MDTSTSQPAESSNTSLLSVALVILICSVRSNGCPPCIYAATQFNLLEMDKPTFVFSLGAWLTPVVFDTLRGRLDTLGYPSECPAHPSIGAEPPSLTLEDDVASLRRVLTTLADEGKDIVLVAHSYGGVVASTASEGLVKHVRAESGKPGGIVKVVYLAAFALDKGQSLLGMLGGVYLPWMKIEVGPSSIV